METITGYKTAQIVNEMLADRELPPIPPQMVYNYLRNGLITGTKGTGQVLTVADANAWAEKYVANRVKRANQSA